MRRVWQEPSRSERHQEQQYCMLRIFFVAEKQGKSISAESIPVMVEQRRTNRYGRYYLLDEIDTVYRIESRECRAKLFSFIVPKDRNFSLDAMFYVDAEHFYSH